MANLAFELLYTIEWQTCIPGGACHVLFSSYQCYCEAFVLWHNFFYVLKASSRVHGLVLCIDVMGTHL